LVLLLGAAALKTTFLTPRRMVLMGYGGIWWDLVGSGGI
jgi:hypothetical protein